MTDASDDALDAEALSAVANAMPRNLHEYRSAESTRRMLEAAAELIVEVGYHKMTLAAIGERAGYSRGLATMRFGSKAGLVQRLVEWSSEGWYDRRAMCRVADRCGYDSAIMLIDGIHRRAVTDPRKLRTFYSLMFE